MPADRQHGDDPGANRGLRQLERPHVELVHGKAAVIACRMRRSRPRPRPRTARRADRRRRDDRRPPGDLHAAARRPPRRCPNPRTSAAVPCRSPSSSTDPSSPMRTLVTAPSAAGPPHEIPAPSNAGPAAADATISGPQPARTISALVPKSTSRTGSDVSVETSRRPRRPERPPRRTRRSAAARVPTRPVRATSRTWESAGKLAAIRGRRERCRGQWRHVGAQQQRRHRAVPGHDQALDPRGLDATQVPRQTASAETIDSSAARRSSSAEPASAALIRVSTSAPIRLLPVGHRGARDLPACARVDQQRRDRRRPQVDPCDQGREYASQAGPVSARDCDKDRPDLAGPGHARPARKPHAGWRMTQARSAPARPARRQFTRDESHAAGAAHPTPPAGRGHEKVGTLRGVEHGRARVHPDRDPGREEGDGDSDGHRATRQRT